jgi:hypothetical protein
MTSPRWLAGFALVLGVGLALLPDGGVAHAAGTPYSAPSGRPHSRVVTYDRGTVRVLALQAAVRRVSGHLTVRASVSLRNLTGETVTRYVRAGRCVGGSGALPKCKADALLAMRLAPGATQAVVRTITLRQPPAKVDAIELVVQPSRTRPVQFFRSDGELLLKGNAWRGPGAGATYGVAFPAADDRARRISWDVPETRPGRAYVDLVWTGTAAPATPTLLSKCTGPTCTTPVKVGPSRSRSGGQKYGDRFDVSVEGNFALGLAVNDLDGTPLITAALPWPAKP